MNTFSYNANEYYTARGNNSLVSSRYNAYVTPTNFILPSKYKIKLDLMISSRSGNSGIIVSEDFNLSNSSHTSLEFCSWISNSEPLGLAVRGSSESWVRGNTPLATNVWYTFELTYQGNHIWQGKVTNISDGTIMFNNSITVPSLNPQYFSIGFSDNAMSVNIKNMEIEEL